MQTVPSLTISDLWLERGERDLCKNFSFELKAGEAIRILGSNGAGKSSLLKAIIGLMTPINGSVFYNGNDVTLDKQQLIQDVIYIGHSTGLKESLTIEENIRRYCPEVSSEKLFDVLEFLDLLDDAKKIVKKLSAGQIRRVTLSRLWLSKRKVWLLDEPFSALDTKGIELLEGHINQHLLKGGMVLLTTHQDLVSVQARTLELS